MVSRKYFTEAPQRGKIVVLLFQAFSTWFISCVVTPYHLNTNETVLLYVFQVFYQIFRYFLFLVAQLMIAIDNPMMLAGMVRAEYTRQKLVRRETNYEKKNKCGNIGKSCFEAVLQILMGDMRSLLKTPQIASYIHLAFILSKIKADISTKFLPYIFFTCAHM